MTKISINPRFNGLPEVALGGYVGGILAHGRARAEAIFRRPIRLGRSYQVVGEADGSEALVEGSEVLAVVRDASVDLDTPPSVGLEASTAAAETYLGRNRHLFPQCFVCGPARIVGDGLRIFPGDVAGSGTVAAPWMPDISLADSNGNVRPEFMWAALDCPTIWALVLHGRPDTDERAVTGRLAVDILSPALAGCPQVVMGWKVGESGRTQVAGGAIYSANGRLLAKAKHTLVTTDWGVPMGLKYWL